MKTSSTQGAANAMKKEKEQWQDGKVIEIKLKNKIKKRVNFKKSLKSKRLLDQSQRKRHQKKSEEYLKNHKINRSFK